MKSDYNQLVVVLLCVLLPVRALKCYTCHDASLNCMKPDATTSTTECPANQKCAIHSAYKGNDTKPLMFTRFCSPGSLDIGCTETNDGKTCYSECKTDLCGGSHASRTSQSSLLIMLSTVLFYFLHTIQSYCV